MFVHGCVERSARIVRAAASVSFGTCLLLAAPFATAASLDESPAPAPTPIVKDAGPFDARVHFPLVPGATWRYTLDSSPPISFRATVDNDTRRVDGVTTRVVRDSDGGTISYTADAAGLRMHQERTADGGVITLSPAAVLIEQGAAPGDVQRRTGKVHFQVEGQRFSLDYDTRSEVIGTEQVKIEGRTVAALRVSTDLDVYGLIGLQSFLFRTTVDRWLVPHLGMARIRSVQEGEVFDSTLDFALVDVDGDGISVLEDNCRTRSNEDQRDTDADGDGDACDNDDDNDGTPDLGDAFPFDPREQLDTDGDGQGNNADRDDDNDGLPDTYEQRFGLDPLDASDAALDSDSDGLDNLSEFARGSSPRLNEAQLLPVLLDILLDD